VKVEVKLEEKDWKALNAYLSSENTWSRREKCILAGGLLGALLCAALFWFGIPLSGNPAFPLQISKLIICSYFGLILFGRVAESLRRNRSKIEWVRFGEYAWDARLSREGLAVEGPHFYHLYGWGYFSEFVRTGNHLFLLRGRCSAVIVPRRAFPNDLAFIEFVLLARSYFDLADPLCPLSSDVPIPPARSTAIQLASEEVKNEHSHR
jgi:hypothetical protein